MKTLNLDQAHALHAFLEEHWQLFGDHCFEVDEDPEEILEALE